MIAEPVKREILPGLYINGWGFNESMPDPTIQVYSGDYVNIRVINHLPQATSVHWHWLDAYNAIDGIPEIKPPPKIEPGGYFDYHFKITNPLGTLMYHIYFNTPVQQMMELGGAFIILSDDKNMNIQRDYFLMFQEFTVTGLMMGEIMLGSYDLDPMSHDFNFFTINRPYSLYVTPLRSKMGKNVRIRLGNIMHDAHPIHIPCIFMDISLLYQPETAIQSLLITDFQRNFGRDRCRWQWAECRQ